MPIPVPSDARAHLLINGERVMLRSFSARDIGRTGEPPRGPEGATHEAVLTLHVDHDEAERLATWDRVLP